jgi:organic hydroperoxide reductase OsmC/OhrA
MSRLHRYSVSVEWTGNTGKGTASYTAYERAHEVRIAGKPVILGSSDPAFRGDASRHNPEDLLVGSLSSCHMLWFLHLCAREKIAVAAYEDEALGTMREDESGAGHFTEVLLRPVVTVLGQADPARIEALHDEAHANCFIAASVNFPVRCEGRLLAPATD